MVRADIGSMGGPLMAGDPLRLEVAAGISVNPNSVSYACFRLLGDTPASTPSFVISGAGIVVTSPIGGQFTVQLPASCTALWSGRDWHTAMQIDVDGNRAPLFQGYIVSTRQLKY